MYFLLFAAALPVVYMVWNKASNKWQLPPPSVFLTAEPKSRQHAVNETFVSAEVVIMMGSLSLLPSLYPQLSVCTHLHHYTDLLPFTPVDTFRIMAGAIFEKLDRAALPAPALRAAAGRTSIIIIVLIWSWSWSWCWSEFWLVTGRLISAECCDHGHWSHTAPWSPAAQWSRVPGYLQSTPLHFRMRYDTAPDEEKLALLLAE